MSRPSSSSSSVRVLDPRQYSKLNIKLGKTLTDGDESFSSVAFNHKSKQTAARRETTFSQSRDSYTAKIEDHDGDNTIGESRYKGIRWSKPASYVLTLDSEGNSLILDKLQSEYAFNLVSAPWETDSQKLEAQYKQVGEDVLNQQGEEDAVSGEDEGLFDEGEDKPDESNPFDYRHYLEGLPQAPRITSAKSTPILAASKPAVLHKPSASRHSIGTTRQVPASRPRPPKKAQPAVPPPQVRLERRASEKRPSPAYEEEEEAAAAAAANNDDSDEGLIIDMGEGYQPQKKRAVNLGVRQPISLRAAASASPPAGFSPAPPEAGSGYEEDDEEDDEEMAEQVEEQDDDADEEGDVTELALDEANESTLSRRQSGWDAAAEAELEAEMLRALEADDEEAAVQVPVQESEEESEEE